MTENKRFKYYEHKGADYILENPNEDLDFIEMLGDCLDSEEIVNRLNELYNENEELIKDNFELQGLLGDVRALLRLSKVDDAISRIDKFERGMKK